MNNLIQTCCQPSYSVADPIAYRWSVSAEQCTPSDSLLWAISLSTAQYLAFHKKYFNAIQTIRWPQVIVTRWMAADTDIILVFNLYNLFGYLFIFCSLLMMPGSERISKRCGQSVGKNGASITCAFSPAVARPCELAPAKSGGKHGRPCTPTLPLDCCFGHSSRYHFSHLVGDPQGLGRWYAGEKVIAKWPNYTQYKDTCYLSLWFEHED